MFLFFVINYIKEVNLEIKISNLSNILGGKILWVIL